MCCIRRKKLWSVLPQVHRNSLFPLKLLFSAKCEHFCQHVYVTCEVGLNVNIQAHHKGLGKDVFNEFEVISLELLALGAGSLGFFIRIETEELRVIFKLALLQN